MVFEKYRARKAHIKELRSYSRHELEIEHWKLRSPHPPSYDDLYGDAPPDATHDQQQQPQHPSSFTSAARTSTTSSASSASASASTTASSQR